MHPGQVILDNRQKRCTPQQALEDRTRVEAAATAAAEKAKATLEEIVSCINKLEDKLQQDSQLAKKYATRPDWRHGGQVKTQSTQKFMTRQMKHAHAAQLDEQIDEEDRYLTT